MKFDFDTPVERRGTASVKWNKYGSRDIIPMWVADMDFACAPAVVEALRKRVDHPIYGYSEPPSGLVDHVRYAVNDTGVPVVVYHRLNGAFTPSSLPWR